MASREAATYFFYIYIHYVSFSYIEMMWKMLGEWKKNRKCEEEEKTNISIRHLKAYPGGGQETQLFLRMA